METRLTTEQPILLGLNSCAADWQTEIAKLPELKIDQLALLLRGTSLENRRALYRALELTPPRFIPCVQLPTDIEEWEIRYLMAKYQCTAFSLPAVESAYLSAAALKSPVPSIYIENPKKSHETTCFNMQSLSRTNIAGVCLDAAVLERNRLHDVKSYEAVIDILDQCAIGMTLVSPMNDGLFARFTKPSKQLHSLKELRYLKHLPPTYLSGPLLLDLENFFDEQLEVQAYLKSGFRKAL